MVDAVGVCERDKSNSRPLEQKKNVPLDKSLEGLALGVREPDALSSLAGRLIRLEKRLDPELQNDLEKLGLASVYKCLRLCDLCKELAFGAPAQKGEVAIFIQLVRAQPVVPPVPGERDEVREPAGLRTRRAGRASGAALLERRPEAPVASQAVSRLNLLRKRRRINSSTGSSL
jgi:hypothetical protein